MKAKKIDMRPSVETNTFRSAVRKKLYAMREDGESNLDHIAQGLIDEAGKGNIPALNMLLAVIGECPNNKILMHENVTTDRPRWG